MRKGSGKVRLSGVRVSILAVLIGTAFFNVSNVAMAQTGFDVTVVVTNAFCDYPIEGVMVEVATYLPKREGLGVDYTDETGTATFTNLPHTGPYEVGISMRGYRGQEFIDVMAGVTLPVALVPRGITTPGMPNAISSPKSVYLSWPANPEYDVKGYNVYRTLTTEDGTALEDPVKLNGLPDVVWDEGVPIPACGDELVADLEFIDPTVVKGSYYIYQIQAISGNDRPSMLSAVSTPAVKGQWLTIFFPDVGYTNSEFEDMFLWDRDDDGTKEVRIPVASRCAYDVDATSMMIVGEITADYLNAEPNSVELTGITAGMQYSASVIDGGAVENVGDHQVLIAGAGVEQRNLYGSGELFNIYLTPKGVIGENCGPLNMTEATEVYDDPFGVAVEREIEDGTYCGNTVCMHGDANFDLAVTEDDSQYILDYLAHKSWAVLNECYMYSWDINLDARITPQDASLILMWARGIDIHPSSAKNASDLALESFAAAAALRNKDVVEVPPVPVWAEKPVLAVDETGDVEVWIRGAAPLAGFLLTVAYPAQEVEFVEATLGSDMPGDCLIQSNVEITGELGEYGNLTVAVTGTDSTKATGDAQLMKLSFKRLTGETEEIPVVLTSFDMNDVYAHAPRQTDPMAPEIVDAPPLTVEDGDLNKDQSINILDLVQLATNWDDAVTMFGREAIYVLVSIATNWTG